MCKNCNNEKGSSEMLKENRVDVEIGYTQLQGFFSLDLYMSRDESDKYTLDATMFAGDNIIAETVMPIQYCPFCGRKLQDISED